MNLPNSKIARTYIKAFLFCLFFFTQVSVKAWEVDMSRRNKDMKKWKGPAAVQMKSSEEETSVFSNLVNVLDPTQDIVILNTEKGFVPDTLSLKKGQQYKIHIVNVNEKEKNASFILDAFSEQHATYFGIEKSFQIQPKVDGIFSFQCPEMSHQGKFVVVSDDARKPAGE